MTIPDNIVNWPELLTAVESNNGITKVPMATLRQLEGRQRVGKHVLSAIDEKLSSLGLGHLPQELPNRHQHSVLLYRYGTPASEVIQAVARGLTEPVNDTTYGYLHRLNSVPDPASVVSKEEFSSAIKQTAQSVLDLLDQVGTERVVTPTKSRVRDDLADLVQEALPVVKSGDKAPAKLSLVEARKSS